MHFTILPINIWTFNNIQLSFLCTFHTLKCLTDKAYKIFKYYDILILIKYVLYRSKVEKQFKCFSRNIWIIVEFDPLIGSTTDIVFKKKKKKNALIFNAELPKTGNSSVHFRCCPNMLRNSGMRQYSTFRLGSHHTKSYVVIYLIMSHIVGKNVPVK